VADSWSLSTIYKGMFQFMMLQCIAIAILVAFPPIATWLPHRLNEASRTRPLSEQHLKIIEQQKKQQSLEDDDFGVQKK